MFDARIRPKIDPHLNRAGVWLADQGIGADAMTRAALALGLAAAVAVALGAPWAGAALVALGRIADGLDGAIARATRKTDLGGFYDIMGDFAFYGALPLGFALAGDPLPAAFLLFAFYVNGASFLAFAILAEKKGLKTAAQGEKSIFYAAGLMEGAETVGFFLAMCLFPEAFAPLAWIFAALCLVTAAARVALASRIFAPES